VSESDSRERPWAHELDAYRRLGVRELVRFDPELEGAGSLRLWDRVDGALVERELSESLIPSSVLPLYWTIAPADEHAVVLRIAGEQRALVPTRLEPRQAEGPTSCRSAHSRIGRSSATHPQWRVIVSPNATL